MMFALSKAADLNLQGGQLYWAFPFSNGSLAVVILILLYWVTKREYQTNAEYAFCGLKIRNKLSCLKLASLIFARKIGAYQSGAQKACASVKKTRLKSNTLAYCSHPWKVGRMGLKAAATFKTLYFLRNLLMGPISECFITLGWKSLPGTNTRAYCSHS